jgi:tryptophan-rich sensory protein
LFLKAAIAVIGVEGVGFAGSLFMARPPGRWYSGLHKPWFNPPDAAFGIVWPILYLMIGLAAALVWQRGDAVPPERRVWVPFYLQLALNFAFTPVFFGLQSPLGGGLVTTALLGAVVWTVLAFRPVSKLAAALLVPYLIWTAFAVVLSWSIVLLNL